MSNISTTPLDDLLEKRYAEIAEKTAAVLAAKEPWPAINDGPPVKRSLPKLPRYQPPPPFSRGRRNAICHSSR
jgi:hypothetical protein